MSKQSTLTAAVATMLGATLGGLFLWRSIRTRKKKALKSPAAAEPVQAQLEPDVTSSEPASREPPVPPEPTPLMPVDALLQVPPVVVSSPEEWEAVWPAFQTDLSAYPVLGLDCEWVKRMRVRVGLFVMNRTNVVLAAGTFTGCSPARRCPSKERPPRSLCSSWRRSPGDACWSDCWRFVTRSFLCRRVWPGSSLTLVFLKWGWDVMRMENVWPTTMA